MLENNGVLKIEGLGLSGIGADPQKKHPAKRLVKRQNFKGLLISNLSCSIGI